MDFNAADICP